MAYIGINLLNNRHVAAQLVDVPAEVAHRDAHLDLAHHVRLIGDCEVAIGERGRGDDLAGRGGRVDVVNHAILVSAVKTGPAMYSPEARGIASAAAPAVNIRHVAEGEQTAHTRPIVSLVPARFGSSAGVSEDARPHWRHLARRCASARLAAAARRNLDPPQHRIGVPEHAAVAPIRPPMTVTVIGDNSVCGKDPRHRASALAMC